MATAAQIEANRRNSMKSTGPRTEEGKNRSRFNALNHGCRANILVLPTEESGEYENELNAWRRSLQPRNPVEEFLVDRIVSLQWQAKRIDRAQTARLSTRIARGEVDAADHEQETVIELGQKLFREACGPGALRLERNGVQSSPDKEVPRVSDYSVDEEHPRRLVHRLQGTLTGCQWLLDQWASLRTLLERGVLWLAPDTLKAVRLLGRHPIDAIDIEDVALVYLACHALHNEANNPFQEIMNELCPDEASVYASYLRRRRYDHLVPKDAPAARQVLLDLVDRATERLQEKAEMLRELAELKAPYTTDLLSWDDTDEGERLRRYELTCKRAMMRMFDLLLKVRRTGGELNIASMASFGRFLPPANASAINSARPAVATVITPTAEPDPVPKPPIEANPARENAPNEPNPARENAPNKPNCSVHTISSALSDGHKEFRIDTPHLERKPGSVAITGKQKMHPAIQRLQTGRGSTVLDLSSIFDGR